MKKTGFILLFLMISFTIASAAERTEPIRMYVLIDTSLSMSEKNRFLDMQRWIKDELLKNMLIIGDTLIAYEFYGNVQKVIDITIKNKDDLKYIQDMLIKLKPDNPYTDIGNALDVLHTDINKYRKNHKNEFIVALLLTDMIQEAPYTSQYAGQNNTFADTFLAQDRVTPHEAWFEIAINTSDQKSILEKSAQLYNTIISKD